MGMLDCWIITALGFRARLDMLEKRKFPASVMSQPAVSHFLTEHLESYKVLFRLKQR
jgi:hypothetical protein